MYHQKETPPTIYAISHQGGENMDLIKYFSNIGITPDIFCPCISLHHGEGGKHYPCNAFYLETPSAYSPYDDVIPPLSFYTDL